MNLYLAGFNYCDFYHVFPQTISFMNESWNYYDCGMPKKAHIFFDIYEELAAYAFEIGHIGRAFVH